MIGGYDWKKREEESKKKRLDFQKELRKFEQSSKTPKERVTEITNKILKESKKKKKKTKEEKSKKFSWKAKTIAKKIMKPSRLTYVVRQEQPAPYVSRYFKEEVEQAKKELFFK